MKGKGERAMMRNRAAVAIVMAGAMASAGAQAKEAVAIFAGGCFWSIESDFDHAPGVLDTTSGYIGGHVDNPTYQQVITETTGHREAVRVTYDPDVTDYATLLDTYWHLIDPIEPNGQFCDFGESYRTGLFPLDEEQMKLGEASKAETEKSLKQPVATTIQIAPTFYAAENYHQNFYRTNADHYKRYRAGCGKNAQVEAIWGEDAFRGLNGHL
jgi:peptide-methionine (S)-S-oxide reductase